MYNKVLKRPMFNMGGRINQATGTGITSGLDTPKRGLVNGPGGYAGRTREEIEAEILALYPEKTPQQKGFDILESYGSLPSAYKDGEYRTIGERLDMRSASYEKKLAEEVALQNKAKLTVLEADMAKNEADEKFERDKIIASIQTTNPLLKDKSVKRQISELTLKLTENAAKNMGAVGSSFILAGYGNGVAIGQIAINELQGGDEIVRASVIPLEYFQQPKGSKQWGFDSKLLAPGMVYWDPIQQSWLTVDSKGGVTYTTSYEESAKNLNLDSEKASATSSSSTDIKVTETDGIQTVSLHPTNEAGEITEDYLLEYADNNKIVFDSETYKAQGGASKGYKLISKIVLKKRLENENAKSQKDEKNKIARDNRLKSDALKYFAQKRGDKTYYELIMEGSLTMPSRFEPFIDEYTETIEVAQLPVENKAVGGRVGYAMGSPEFQGEVVTEELEEIQPDTSVDELADLQTWWKSEIEKDFNA